MSWFKEIVGIEESQVQETCLVIPYLMPEFLKGFGLKELKRGKLFSAANVESLTVIRAGIGAPLVGDAVLHLRETQVKRIIFFGSCGLLPGVPNIGIGNLVCPTECLAYESFTEVLHERTEQISSTRPDPIFLQKCFDEFSAQVHSVKGMTFGSLFLEKQFVDFFREQKVQVIDMEVSAFFAASKKIQRPAIALMVVTDIVGQETPFSDTTPSEKRVIAAAIVSASKIIKSLSKDRRLAAQVR